MSTRKTSNWIRRPAAILALIGAALAVAACGSDSGGTSTSSGSTNGETTSAGTTSTLPTGSEPVTLDPADFTTDITNPYWPMKPGTRWVYSEADGDGNTQRVVVTVTDQTKKIANGVEARVVNDVVSTPAGEPVEVTTDWFAQDSDGNVWYLGENTAEYENGKVASRSGSFEAGVGGAQAGIAIPADPEPGLAYRQEYLAGEAEDSGKVIRLDATAKVPFGSYNGVLETEDTNPLDNPVQIEHKYYAKGIGPVLTVNTSAGGREGLVSYTPGG